MAQPQQIQLDQQITSARRSVKRVLAEAKQANIELARLQQSLSTYAARLASYGIQLEVEE